MYTVIHASDDQCRQLYFKHMAVESKIVKSFFGIFSKEKIVSKIVPGSSSYSFDDEDGIGFFSCHTITGKRISCQVRGEEPMFVEFTGFGSIRYDVDYPQKQCTPMYQMLKELCKKAKENFWRGGEI